MMLADASDPPIDVAQLQPHRLAHWRQTRETRVPDPDAAVRLIDQVGIVTLFPASPEIPNLYHAYTGDPNARPEAEWDSPAGEVYGWRWALGRRSAAFYTALVRSRPTWVSWELLPALLRLRGERRTPDELYRVGELSSGAHGIARALADSEGVLSTADLRREAGFPTGKQQRAAYLKAVEELDTRLLLAKVFAAEDEDMRHALVSVRYPEAIAQAEYMSEAEAIARLLAAYLPHAIYAAPAVLAKHLKLAEPRLRTGLDRMVEEGQATKSRLASYKGDCYIWQAGEG